MISDKYFYLQAVQADMEHLACCLVLFLMTSSVCSVFYTNTSHNDYIAKIGRRSFYTKGDGNHYPRIGRRDATTSQILLPGLKLTDLLALDKRGVFTIGTHGSYPRVGRSDEEEIAGDYYMNEIRNEISKKLAGLDEEVEKDDKKINSYLLDVMFIAFDTDSEFIYLFIWSCSSFFSFMFSVCFSVCLMSICLFFGLKTCSSTFLLLIYLCVCLTVSLSN